MRSMGEFRGSEVLGISGYGFQRSGVGVSRSLR